MVFEISNKSPLIKSAIGQSRFLSPIFIAVVLIFEQQYSTTSAGHCWRSRQLSAVSSHPRTVIYRHTALMSLKAIGTAIVSGFVNRFLRIFN
jgi:hypothetical protein